MAVRPDSEAPSNRAKRGVREKGSRTATLARERLSCATARRPSENPVRNPNASSLVSLSAALVLIATLATGGCVRQLAVEDEYFAAAGESGTRSRVATQHLVSHHRALQVAQHSCSTVPTHSDTPPGNTQPSAGPEIGSSVASEALRRLCASMPPRLPVAAHGASSNAYRRWVEDNVRELPEASRTAASAAGGS